MSDRIRQLEDGLAILQSSVTRDPHPLLATDLLKIKSGLELHSASELELQREREGTDRDDRPLSPVSNDSGYSGSGTNGHKAPLPSIFTDPGWQLLSTSILSIMAIATQQLLKLSK